MSRTVEWSPKANTDLLDQLAYIAADNPSGVDNILDRIQKTADALGEFATGHPGRFAGTYEKTIRGLPYILAYALTDDDRTVSIVRLIHTARDWPEGDWPE